MPSLFWMLLAAARSGPRPFRVIMHLLAELRAVCHAEAAEGVEGFGQSVSTLQAIGYGYAADTDIQAHGSAEAAGHALAVTEAPLSVVLGLAGDSVVGFALAQAAEAVEGYGQSVTELLGVAMADSMGLVYGYGQTVCISEGYLLGGTAEGNEAAGSAGGYLTGSLAPDPGCQECLPHVLLTAGDGGGTLYGENQDEETVLMMTESQLESSCFAEALATYTVTFMGAGEIAHQETVLEREPCPDPWANGTIPASTKEQTVSHTFNQNGWTRTEGGDVEPDVLASITEDTVLYPAFEASIRYYTVRFYDNGVHVDTVTAPYGGTAETDYMADGFNSVTWVPSNENITGDTDCHGQFSLIPFAEATWEQIVKIAESGKASSSFAIGDEKDATLTYADGSTETVTFVLAGFDECYLYDGTSRTDNARSNMILVTKNALEETRPLCSHNGAYCDSATYGTLWKFLTQDVYQALPEELRKGVKAKDTDGYSWIAGRSTYCWMLDFTELGLTVDHYSNTDAIQFPLFTNNASRIKHAGNDGYAVSYWTLSEYSNTGTFINTGIVTTSGSYSITGNRSSTNYGVVFGICI